MKRITLLLLLAIIFASCRKDYKCHIIAAYENEIGKIESISWDCAISVKNNDTLAWAAAYEWYCLSQKVWNESHLYKNDTISFVLISPTGDDISNAEFATKEQLKREIEEKIFSNK